MSIIPSETYSNRLDILTAGYRTIRLDRIYKDNVPSFDSQGTNGVVIPKLNQVKSELKNLKRKNCLNVLMEMKLTLYVLTKKILIILLALMNLKYTFGI